jgi:hypothetical protein
MNYPIKRSDQMNVIAYVVMNKFEIYVACMCSKISEVAGYEVIHHDNLVTIFQ